MTDTQLFIHFYQVITGKDICFLFAIAFVVLYAFFRLLAVKAKTSRVGHLSPSARGLTTVKTLLIFQDMCAPRIKMELFRCPNCHDMLLSNTCRSIPLIGYVLCIYMIHFLCAIGFRSPCACNHSICSLSSQRNVLSFVAMYRPSIVASFFRKQANFMWK